MALPSTPNGLCVTSTVNALSLRVNWNSVDGVSGYNLYYSAIPHDEFTSVVSSFDGLTYYHNPQSSVLTHNLRNRWFYKVSAVNADGEGTLSAPSTYRPYGQLVDTNTPTPGLSMWGLING